MGTRSAVSIAVVALLAGCYRETSPTPAPSGAAGAAALASAPAPADEATDLPLPDVASPQTPAEGADIAPPAVPVGRAGPLLEPCEAFALDAAWAAKPEWDGREVVSHSEDWREVIVRTGPDSRRLHTPLRFHWDPTWGYQLVEEDEWERSTSVE